MVLTGWTSSKLFFIWLPQKFIICVGYSWEYPNADGIGCNVKSESDASNFLTFLQALRAEPAGSNITLSAATSIKPFNGPDGTPLSDVSQFSQVLDFIGALPPR